MHCYAALHIITDNCRSNSIRLCIASSCMCMIQCTLYRTHRHIFLTTARLIKCSHTTEKLETASSILRWSYIVKLSHQYVFIYCRVATWALLCCIPQWSQRWNNPMMVVGETSWPFADLRMYILHILMYFFSTRLLTEIWAAQDCKSRIILRWIKKTFHYHNPVD